MITISPTYLLIWKKKKTKYICGSLCTQTSIQGMSLNEFLNYLRKMEGSIKLGLGFGLQFDTV